MYVLVSRPQEGAMGIAIIVAGGIMYLLTIKMDTLKK
ncbi:MAG: hypothetical protein ACI8W6_001072 [Porticoccaceae bacterium]